TLVSRHPFSPTTSCADRRDGRGAPGSRQRLADPERAGARPRSRIKPVLIGEGGDECHSIAGPPTADLDGQELTLVQNSEPGLTIRCVRAQYRAAAETTQDEISSSTLKIADGHTTWSFELTGLRRRRGFEVIEVGADQSGWKIDLTWRVPEDEVRSDLPGWQWVRLQRGPDVLLHASSGYSSLLSVESPRMSLLVPREIASGPLDVVTRGEALIACASAVNVLCNANALVFGKQEVTLP
ncbi:MAG TPA: hypothetical protein VFV33_25215, partial [Gemmatimonadaceae bacterium]|nr:hypothetical protein [Gemmatimonadaceae bacterium]